MKSIEGALIVLEGAKFAIVGSRFNSFIVERLIEGAIDALVRHGADGKNQALPSAAHSLSPGAP